MSSANAVGGGGTPGYSLPTADPGPAVAADPAGRIPTGSRPPGTGPTSSNVPGIGLTGPNLPGIGPASPNLPGVGPTAPHSPGYRDWARDQRVETGGAATDQRGTVYGGPEGHVTVSMPVNAVENSGSLTGHILAQGWTDTPAQKTDNAKVVLVLLVGLGILVAIGLLVVLMLGDAFNNLFDGLLSG
ncbi:hypothetical protein O7626_32515 [Micromonospora sp. WMMD1102]|uniref:hypothetical protein n=1 Tax=Micromonospora sp. WMMD1102 TaxID=3016105 RepID=UPI002414D8F9|nr:hypothetical protein [Micromonospora sp. WMMD1102]MDG4790584.1 hypothetical protein [Micromonospora sp. WMMD1102]